MATGSTLDRGAGLGAYMTSLFHVTGMLASMLAGILADRLGRIPVMLMMASLSAACSLVFGWLLGTPVAVVVALGLVYGFAALGDSPIYSTAITEVVTPAFRGAALALRSLAGYGAGAIAPLLFGAILDWYGGRSAEAWGWAFVSLGVAGLVAVASVLLLYRAPGPTCSCARGSSRDRRRRASGPRAAGDRGGGGHRLPARHGRSAPASWASVSRAATWRSRCSPTRSPPARPSSRSS